jgi:hypothetical protein
MDTTRDVMLNTLLLQKGRNPDFPLSPNYLGSLDSRRLTWMVSLVSEMYREASKFL